MALGFLNIVSRLKFVVAVEGLVLSSIFTSLAHGEDAAQNAVGPQVPSAAIGTQPAPQGEQATPPKTQPSVTKYDDWYYRCVDGKGPDGIKTSSCEAAQIATVKKGDQTVNVLTLAFAKAAAGDKKVPASGLLLTTLVPLNVYLPAGLSIEAGDKALVQLAYRNCNQAGCWAQQAMDTKKLAALEKKTDGIGHLQLMDGRKVDIKFSLKGLSSALEALNKPLVK